MSTAIDVSKIPALARLVEEVETKKYLEHSNGMIELLGSYPCNFWQQKEMETHNGIELAAIHLYISLGSADKYHIFPAHGKSCIQLVPPNVE